MKIVIVNDVHAGKPLMHGNQTRSSSRTVMNMFELFLQSIVRQHEPELIINLGDLIRSETKEIDLERYQDLLGHYRTLKLPVLHLVGNHEIKHLHFKEIESAWKTYGFDQERFGLKSFHNVDVIWLAIEKDETSKNFTLPQDQMSWLETALTHSVNQKLIFIHCPIDDQNVEGNFFYEFLDDRKKDKLFLTNQNEVRELIHSKKNIVGVFQAHLHYFHAHNFNGISYITCPAMNDNICGTNEKDHNPEIYTVVDIDQNKLIVKAYSTKYCYAGYEQDLKRF